MVRFERVFFSVPRFARQGKSLVRELLDRTLRAEGQGKGSNSRWREIEEFAWRVEMECGK
jgi:hypothetical protein